MTYHRKTLRLAAAFILTTLLVASSWADPRIWGVNAIPVRQGHHIEWFRANYRASDGSVMVAWSDTRLGDRDIYAQVVNPGGQQIWGSTGQALVQVPQYRQEDPDIAALPNGYWIVAWNEFRNDSLGDVWAQKFDPQGRPVWNFGGDSSGVEIDALPETMVNEITVRCVHDGAGGAIIAWEDPRRGDPGDIFAQHVDANGDVTWADPLRVTDIQGEQVGITAESDGQGNMIVAWKDRRDASNQNVYCAKVTPQGTLPWGGQNGLIVCGANGLQDDVKIASDGSGGAYLIWSDMRAGATRDIYAQRVSAAGEPQWTAEGVLVVNALEDQQGPRIGLSMNGGNSDGAIVVWEDLRVNGLVVEVYAQKISTAGLMQWTANGVFVCGDADPSGGNHRLGGRLTTDMQGGAVIAWEDTREDGNLLKADLYAARIQANGTFAWGQDCGLAIASAPGGQVAPLLRVDEGDQVIVFWDDWRTGSQSIRYQKLSIANGQHEFDSSGVLVVKGLDGDALRPQSVPMNNHRVGVVWQDNRMSFGGSRLFYQIVLADSTRTVEKVVNGDPITTGSSGTQTNQDRHDVCTDGAGGFFVSFEDNRTGTKAIRLSHVNSSGLVVCSVDADPVWPPPVGQDQQFSQVAYDHEGGCYVAWSGYSAAFSLDIFVMRMTSACQPAWALPVQLTDSPGTDDLLYELITNPDGCCIGVWQSGEFSTENVSGARVCHDGSVTWNFDVCNAPNTQEDPTVLADGLGGVYFCWGDYRDPNFSKDIFAQHVAANGTPTWTANGIAVLSGMVNLQQKPFLAIDSQRNLTVIWEDYRSGEHLDLFAQKITPAGQRLWQAEGKPICNARLAQENTAAYVEWADGIYVNWTDSRGAYSDLYGTHLTSSGNVTNSYWQPDSGNVICDFYQRQDFPTMANDGWGGIVSTWQDARASGKDPLVNIWCQWVNDWSVDVAPLNHLPLPKVYKLAQNFPNPFNPATTINFSIPTNERVELAVYNTMGQTVATLVDEILSAGTYDVHFNAPSLASGVYFYRLKTPSFQSVKKMTMLK